MRPLPFYPGFSRDDRFIYFHIHPHRGERIFLRAGRIDWLWCPDMPEADGPPAMPAAPGWDGHNPDRPNRRHPNRPQQPLT